MSEFWDWAVAAYARPGVAELCLDLQDSHNQNVPLLLWAIWRGGDAAAALALARQWEDEVVGPLRQARRNLKPYGRFEALRERVKAVELEAERTLMAELERLAGAVADPGALETVTSAWGGSPPAEALAGLRAAITAA